MLPTRPSLTFARVALPLAFGGLAIGGLLLAVNGRHRRVVRIDSDESPVATPVSVAAPKLKTLPVAAPAPVLPSAPPVATTFPTNRTGWSQAELSRDLIGESLADFDRRKRDRERRDREEAEAAAARGQESQQAGSRSYDSIATPLPSLGSPSVSSPSIAGMPSLDR